MCAMKDRPLQTKIIYGPVNSRRLGRSLGVNILPTRSKVCSFDCIYCQYGHACCHYEPGFTGSLPLPSPGEVSRALDEALGRNMELEVITLAGNGEPTLHPRFAEIASVVAGLRDCHRPGTPVCILSNASTLSEQSVRKALEHVDLRIMKLDAGTQEAFERVNRPAEGLLLERIIGNLAALDAVIIQSLFFDGPGSNASAPEVEAWLKALERIDPDQVQIYSLDRTPADPSLRQVPAQRLEEIAALARNRLPRARIKVF